MAQDDISAAASAMARKRIAGLTKAEKYALASKGGYASWAGMSPEERRLEMRRRAGMRKRNRIKKAKLLRAVK